MKRSNSVSLFAGRARPQLEMLEDRTLLSLLFSNGRHAWVTGQGNGANGANTSQIQAGGVTFGYSAVNTSFHLADAFTVPDTSPNGWSIDSFTIYTYQTGSTTNSPITGVFLRLWDGTNGSPGAGATVIADTSGNVLDTNNNAWTGVYRVADANNLMNTQRPVMHMLTDLSGWSQFQNATGGVLAPGTYWIEWGLTGNSALAGPWTPPTTADPNTGVARQLTVSNNTWGNVLDTGGMLGHQDLLFDVNGTDLGGTLVGEFGPAVKPAGAALPVNGTTSSEAGQGVTSPLDVATLDQVHAATVQDQGAPVATLTAQPASTDALGNALNQNALLS